MRDENMMLVQMYILKSIHDFRNPLGKISA
jgi:hypothetical protein